MKTIFRFTVFLQAVCLLPSWCAADSEFRKPLVIGVSTPITELGVLYGEDLRKVLEFTANELSTESIKLIIENDKCSNREAATVAQKFVGINKVDAVLGFVCSGTALAAAPILEKHKIPTMVTCASSSEIANAGQYIFRIVPSDADAARLLYRIAAKKQSHLGIISAESDYNAAFRDTFVEEADREGRLKLTNFDFMINNADFKTILLRLKNSGVDSLFLNTQDEADGVTIIKQLAQLNWQPQLYGAYYFGAKSFLDKVSNRAENAIFVDGPDLESMITDEGKKIYQRFLNKYGELNFPYLFLSNYEGLKTLVKALRSGGEPHRYLADTSFSGIFGTYSFDEQGEIAGLSLSLKEIKEGRPRLLSPTRP